MDTLMTALDSALRTLFAPAHPSTPCPTATSSGQALTATDKAHAGALMRINHVGEVCAQALYTAQALATRDDALRQQLRHAAAEETDHLAWTQQRLTELNTHPSRLNPLWYAGAFGIGLIAGKLGGDKLSLGFVEETENQVTAHLERHLSQLPVDDHASRAIVSRMRDDEARHAAQAREAGAVTLPAPVQGLMRLASKVMTTVAYRI
jgi:ubiquinone biosynthesis monooxygenase Coq7